MEAKEKKTEDQEQEETYSQRWIKQITEARKARINNVLKLHKAEKLQKE